jgi:two-component system sensor histidine kinase QseC
MPSIRRHLLLGAAVAITAVFAALATILYVSVRTWLVAEFDRGLVAQAESLMAATEFHHGKVRIDFDGQQPAQFVGGPNAQYFELWEAGQVVTRSPSLNSRDLPVTAPPPGRSEFRFDGLPDGAVGREIATNFELRRDPDDGEESATAGPLRASLTLVVARNTSQLSSALAQLKWLLIAACGAALLIGLAMLAWIIRRGLAPVDAIAARIAGVGRASLSDRLLIARVPRELVPVVERLNEMLSRLESAFNRERAFTADVAHELRTPLAGLETSLEVCSSRTRRPEEYQKVVGQCLSVTRSMHAMVDSLLVLARADAGGVSVSTRTFQLETLIDECWQPFVSRAGERNLTLARTGHSAESIRADRDKVRQVLQNLFDNAVSYADEGGRVTVAADRTDESLSLTVSNTGSHLTQEEADRACERFWRGDKARSLAGGHCGLGLSIARELVALMHGQIHVQSTAGGQFVVAITLPVGRGEAGAASPGNSEFAPGAERADAVAARV